VSAGRVAIRHVAVVGLMGSGKSTVGAALAERLGWPLVDSDVVLERKLGQTVREWRDRMGTDSLHALEAEQLRDALADAAASVIAPAASTIDDAACRQALTSDDILVVWLRAATTVIAERFAEAGHRPAFGPDPVRFLADQATARDPGFAAVADLTLETDKQTVERAVDSILARLAG
jgi:shikimate kinase